MLDEWYWPSINTTLWTNFNKEIIYQAPWGQVWAEQYAHQYYNVVYGT